MLQLFGMMLSSINLLQDGNAQNADGQDTSSGESTQTPPGDGQGSGSGANTDNVMQNEAPEGTVTDSLNDAASRALDLLGTTFEQTPVIGWIVLFAGILGGLIVGRITRAILNSIGKRLDNRGWTFRGSIFHSAARPTSLCFFAAGLGIGLTKIKMESELAGFAADIIQFLYIVAIGWFIYNLVDLVDVALRRFTSKTASSLDDMIAPLIRKALRIFVVVIFVLFVAENVFGADITAWIAGLGIAGLAVSLSAQDSIKNIFGSITILLDKPFMVGDRIKFSGVDGFVEEIGFRSTRIRTFEGHLVTIPNMKFIDGQIENVSRRPFIRRTMNITITYDTPREKIERAVEIVKELLNDDDMTKPFKLDERPPRVYFNDLNADSLNIQAIYWYFLDESKGHDWWGYLDHGQRFNLALFKAFGEEGIDFAFPTQTLYLAGDPDRQLAVRVLQDEKNN